MDAGNCGGGVRMIGQSFTLLPVGRWAGGPVGRWAGGPVGRWAGGPAGRRAGGPVGAAVWGRASVDVRLPVVRDAAGRAGNGLADGMMLRRGQFRAAVVEVLVWVAPEPFLVWLEAPDHRVPGRGGVRAGVLAR